MPLGQAARRGGAASRGCSRAAGCARFVTWPSRRHGAGREVDLGAGQQVGDAGQEVRASSGGRRSRSCRPRACPPAPRYGSRAAGSASSRRRRPGDVHEQQDRRVRAPRPQPRGHADELVVVHEEDRVGLARGAPQQLVGEVAGELPEPLPAQPGLLAEGRLGPAVPAVVVAGPHQLGGEEVLHDAERSRGRGAAGGAAPRGPRAARCACRRGSPRRRGGRRRCPR